MCDPAMRTLGLYEGEPAPPLPPGVPPGATILSLEEIKSGDESEVKASTRSFHHSKRRHKSPIPGELSAGETFDLIAKGKDFLDQQALAKAMRACGQSCSREQARALLDTYDTSGDGLLSRDEFVLLIDEHAHLAAAAQVSALRNLREHVVGYSTTIAGYFALFKYLCLVLLLMIVIMGQNSASQQASSIKATVEDALYDVKTGTIEMGNIVSSVGSADDIIAFLEKMVSTVFIEPTCGDGICEAPEEYPTWLPAADGREFTPCMSDCPLRGSAISVRVNFDDVMKLQAAYLHANAMQQSGLFFGKTTTAWGVADNEPKAGWNLCSRDEKEYGFFDTVCVFDADLTIEGLPYRTTELDNTDSHFGGSVDLELFAGNWELRIAYDGWDLGAGLHVAHPAVRGSLQLYVNNTWTNRQYFAPCPNAAECRSQWVQGRYLSNCEAFVGYEEVDDWRYGYGYYSEPEPLTSTLGQPIEWWNLEQELWCQGYSDPVADVTDDFSVGNHGKILSMLLHTQPGFNYSGSYGAIGGGYIIKDEATSVNVMMEGLGDNYAFYSYAYSSTYEPSRTILFFDPWGWPEGWYGYGELGIWGADQSCDGLCSDIVFAGDGNCDWKNNNIFGNWDGGDCCCDTCNDPAGLGICEVLGGCASEWGDCVGPLGIITHFSKFLDLPPDWTSDQLYTWDDDDGYDDDGSGVDDEGYGDDGSGDDAGSGSDSGGYGGDDSSGYGDDSSGDGDDGSGDDDDAHGDDGYGYGDDGSGRRLANDDAGCSSQLYCSNTDGLATDVDLDGCDGYSDSPSWCGGYDDEDFSSNDMCCACGGGCGTESTDDGDYFGYSDRVWDYCLKFGSALSIGTTCELSEIQSGTAAIKYPFTYWRAIKDIITYYEGPEAFDMSRIPTMACPDCPTYNGSYFQVSFALEVDSEGSPTLQIGATTDQQTEIFPGLELTRARFLGPNNLIVIGPLLSQLRFHARECNIKSSRFQGFLQAKEFSCRFSKFRDEHGELTTAISTEDYGIDATFSDQSSIYRESNWALLGDDDAQAILPHGFSYAQGSGRSKVRDTFEFPVLFDVNFNASKANQLMAYLDEGNYIDDQTAEVHFMILTFNPIAGLWGLTKVKWSSLAGGNWGFEQSTAVIDLDRYYTTDDHVQAGIEVLFCVVLLWFMIKEFREMNQARMSDEGLIGYLSSFENVLDLCAYSLLMISAAVWLDINFGSVRSAIEPRMSIPVYDDFFAQKDLLRMKADEQEELEDFFYNFIALQEDLTLYRTITMAALLVMVIQLVAKLNFHPRLGVISRTLLAAASDLVFFFILFIFITMVRALGPRHARPFLSCVLTTCFRVPPSAFADVYRDGQRPIRRAVCGRLRNHRFRFRALLVHHGGRIRTLR